MPRSGLNRIRTDIVTRSVLMLASPWVRRSTSLGMGAG